MFMEMICACMDMTNYYMQRTAEESYIDTARLDSSLIKLGKNLGYNPRRRVPAKCNLQIQIKGPLPQATQPGDTVVFNQDVVDLVFQGRHFILDSSYSYTFSSEDMEGKNSTSWKKTLELACPSQYVHYMPLQGKSLYNAANLVPISCFQGVKVVKEILGNANLGKLGKIAQYYDIDDITFSNWYGKRDPYAFYKGNYSPRLSWTKVGTWFKNKLASNASAILQTQDLDFIKVRMNINNVLAEYHNVETHLFDVLHTRYISESMLTDDVLNEVFSNMNYKYITPEDFKTIFASSMHSAGGVSSTLATVANNETKYIKERMLLAGATVKDCQTIIPQIVKTREKYGLDKLDATQKLLLKEEYKKIIRDNISVPEFTVDLAEINLRRK